MEFMKIAIIGAGHVGGTIGRKWEAAGHEVTYGLRDPSRKAGARPIAEALAGAEAILLAIPAAGVKQIADQHAGALDGKIVLDATNNFGAAASFHIWDVLRVANPRAHLYRAFNSYGYELFDNANVGGTQADMFYAGPEGASKDRVEGLIRDVGLNPIWVGGVDAVDTVDGALRLWFALSRRHGRRIAFKLITD
jgi:predicted dinucleotide-binding enzyme